jgi:radical SAM protein with 4Fe4S-binding SPASM domain
MELIVKPTQRCDFSCQFCSSTNIAKSNAAALSHDRIFQFLKRFPDTRSIIVNGGEPLLMGPEYYLQILDWIDKNNLSTKLSITTNLWKFYHNPKIWISLFQHPNVGITTSFQYGPSRKINKNKIFTENDFTKISDMMLEWVGYRPDFISVMDQESMPFAIENVKLAKKLGVQCKLNRAMSSGRQSQPTVLADMYELYLKIYELGLAEFEYNTSLLIKKTLSGQGLGCPSLRNCDSHIRALNPDGEYYSCGSFADDQDYKINFDSEMQEMKIETPLSDSIDLISLKSDCLSCSMFDLCNGCRKTIRDIKNFEMVDMHCAKMHKQSQSLQNAGWC